MGDLPCLVCRQQRSTIGALCRDCARELRGSALTPEQLVRHGPQATPAGLVDVWGRVHSVAPIMIVGRDFEGDGLLLLEASVSRAHAKLTARDGRWTICDLESVNGTYVEETLVTGELDLHDGDRLQFGTIALFFLEHVSDAPLVDPESLAGCTERSTSTTKRLETVPAQLPRVALRLQEPSGGGGGLLSIDGKHVQLTVAQFELLSMLITRMLDEQQRPERERGFVHPNELVARLSLETTLPREDHVRHLVRRLRRGLAKAGIDSLIETRYGVGYRFRGTPSFV